MPRLGKPALDIVGQKFHMLTVIARVHQNDNLNRALWLCKCDCGKERVVSGAKLRMKSYPIKCCGCSTRAHNSNRCDQALREMYFKYKSSAKKRGHQFDITVDFFKTTVLKRCNYCGAEPERVVKTAGTGRKLAFGEAKMNGLDRKDNNIGYVTENCVSCCQFCNFAKYKFSESEFLNWANRLAAYQCAKINS